jgi:nucleotide-binding universal stress UspA family protein
VFDNVLVGYEGSERSEDAVALALAVTGPKGTVTAACSYWWEPLSARVGKSGPGEPMMRAGAEETLAPLRYRGGADLRTVATPGSSAADALLSLAEDGDHDLVIVGSTHRGAAGRVLAGTTADALLHRGHCPVAVAPRGYRERTGGLRRIGAAFDGTEPSCAALAAAHALAREHGAELVVLRAFSRVPVLAAGNVGYAAVINEPELHSAAQSELDEAVRNLGGEVPVTGELLDGDAGTALADRSAALDLLVVGSKGHGALGRILLGSVSHDLMCEASAPVVVVPPDGRRHNSRRGGHPQRT